ncbi:MAG: DUF3488 domain-containing protein [Cyanobacterium sp. T60_A2020_053]|nr:DUF3488 domain-containing protein [Cyanobacterium sp. T60_A2020_053]
MEKLKQVLRFEEIISQIKALPAPLTEESILLRVLVQLMVIVGVIATDVAAVTDFPMSIWAIPLSVTGAIVSWRRRKKKNIALKFILAMTMIATLFFFLGNLVRSLFDNRLVLAGFLVQLQVLHSFDLPRRKDLGYSMVIGLILMGVAGTLSQTVAFAPWLLLFLLIAIPAMILDYRSRMGLPIYENEYKSSQKKGNGLKNSSLAPKKITAFISITVVIGLIIFAIMPRYPGYQLQTFPVSAPEALENLDFSQAEAGGGIVNPGYNREGENGSGTGGNDNVMGGDDEGRGAGQVDDTFYYGFNTKINQNLRGSMTNRKIVLRIRSQAPGFWRAMAFDQYNGTGWEISRENQILEVDRNPWNYQFNFAIPDIKADTEGVIQTFTVVSDLPNIIPLLPNPRFLYFPTDQIVQDTEDSLRSPAGLIEGLTYTVVSKVPKRNQTELSQTGNNYPDSISKYYLQIPEESQEIISQKTQELLSKANRELNSNYDKALYLAQAIKQNYFINGDIPPLAEGEDLATAFLTKFEGGYPDHFSTVYTLMLRSIGIPARLVVGFAPGQFNPFTGYYIVHNTDAYAMTEVYFPEYGWYYFDPIPGNEIIPPSVDDDNTFGILGQLWDWVASWLPSPITAFITIFFEKIVDSISDFLSSPWLFRLWRFLTGGFIGFLVGAFGLIILAFLGWLGFSFAQKMLYRQRLSQLPPMAKLYQQTLDFLTTKGYPKHKAQTPREYADRLREFLQPEQVDIIILIADGYVRWRYGKEGVNVEYLTQQFQLLQRSFNHQKGKKQLIMNNE